MEVYKIIGFSEFSFKDQPGVKWVKLHCVFERNGVNGIAVEQVNVRQNNLTGGLLELNKKCHVFYNRFGKVQSVDLIEE